MSVLDKISSLIDTFDIELELKSEEEEEFKVDIPKMDEQVLREKLSNNNYSNINVDELISLYKYKAKYVINDDGSCRFWPTPNCIPSKDALNAQKISMEYIASRNGCESVEAYSNPNKNVIGSDSNINSFIKASLTAWSYHYPFKFKCEHIWLLILQAVAICVDQNAEKLRSKYVKHEGKKELKVRRDGFVFGSPDNDWKGVINEFVQQIDKNTIDDTVELFECNFSSSTLTERIATKITVMDICKNYFKYSGCTTLCGFPQITLDGTKKDWILLKKKCIKLLNEKIDAKSASLWSNSLLPLIDRFIAAFDGNIDCLFWNSMIKRGATHGSGARSWITGWFNILFPFTAQHKYNYCCTPYSVDAKYVKQGFKSSTSWTNGHEIDDYPSGLASAPVEWTYFEKKINLKFLSGFVGYVQDENTLEITPNIDWCIAHKK